MKVIVVSCPFRKIERKIIIKTYIYIYIYRERERERERLYHGKVFYG